MFERFTQRARQVIVWAQQEARALSHDYIGTEHLLLGLLREEEGMGARTLRSLGVSFEGVHAGVVRIVGPGDGVTSAQIPFTPRAKHALELALSESLRLGHNYIGTEHILLGLARENGGVAARILLDLDIGGDEIGDVVVRMLSGQPPVPSRPEPRSPYAMPSADSSHREPIADAEIELGWRKRPVALAALGAAVLARSAFAPMRTGTLAPLEMQLLAFMSLRPPDAGPEREASVASLGVALACAPDELEAVVGSLVVRGLLSFSPDQEESAITITARGVTAVEQWLLRILSLFEGWPPDHPGVDDATG